MPNKWKIGTVYEGGEKTYIVYRLLDVDEGDYSGNREIIGRFDNGAHAREFADYKNKEEC